MADPARTLGRAVLDALRAATPANASRPAWVLLGAEGRARGYRSTRNFRAWCLAHGVTIRTDSSRVSWVSPAEVDAAIAGLPIAARRPGDALDDEVDRALGGRR